MLKDQGFNAIEEETQSLDKQFKDGVFKELRIPEFESFKDSKMLFGCHFENHKFVHSH